VNTNELSLRLREDRSSQRLNAMMMGQDASPEIRSIETPSPRSRESTHPDRFSFTRNVVTPTRSGFWAGKPTARKAQSLSGEMMSQQAKASTPKGDG